MSFNIIDLDVIKKNSDDSYHQMYDLIRKSCLNIEHQQKLFKAIGEYLDCEIELEKVCNQ